MLNKGKMTKKQLIKAISNPNIAKQLNNLLDDLVYDLVTTGIIKITSVGEMLEIKETVLFTFLGIKSVDMPHQELLELLYTPKKKLYF